MRSLKEIRDNYQFTADDAQRLNRLKPVMELHVEEIAGALSAYIMSTKTGARLLTQDARRAHLFEAQKKWFMSMFSGIYDHAYYEGLIRIGVVHVKRGIDAHYLNRAVNIIRTLCVNILYELQDSEQETVANIIAFEKILDINLDIMTSSYIEEEIRNYSSMYRIKSALIDFSEKFLQSANLILVLALIGLTLGAIGLFIVDVQKLFMGDLEKGIITSLGSLLIIWVMIELMNTEISHLKGGKFRISVFVSVALVAVIRETMIATLKHEQSEMMVYLIASILVIGFVYWLVVKGEEQQR
jgi:uncharacterized membrane protein (DUF373 family)